MGMAEAEAKSHYRVLPNPILRRGNLEASSVDPSHIEPIRQWRNAQIGVLRQSQPITPDEQATYFANHVWPEKISATPSKILLTLKEDGALIGYGGLVHINWDYRRAEISFLLDPNRAVDDVASAPVFVEFLHIMEELAFTDLHLTRLMTETYAQREPFIAALDAHGFQREGRLRSHVLLEGKPMDAILHGLLSSDRASRP